MTITVDESLLSDIEAKAKAATHGNWVYEEVPVYNKPARMVRSANGYSVADIGLPEDGDHIARMDPLTTLALIARIRELEAKSAADLADYETSLETMTAAHEAKVRELEAENDKLKHDIAVYINANSDLLDECDAARGRALEEAAKLADAMGGELRDDGTTIGMLQDCGKETANILAAQIRSLITKEGE